MTSFRTAALLVAACGVASAQTQHTRQALRACLNAVTVDDVEVVPCNSADSLKIGDNAVIKSAAAALEVDLSQVVFRGCPGAAFSASEDTSDGAKRYVVTYPLEQGISSVGPLVHELAHLHQFKASGGLRALDTRYTSLEIELGADFMAGLVYKKALTDVRPGDYETGISLMGKYYESGIDQHGSPAQRTSAFRRGFYFQYTKHVPSIATASLYFYEGIYGEM